METIPTYSGKECTITTSRKEAIMPGLRLLNLDLSKLQIGELGIVSTIGKNNTYNPRISWVEAIERVREALSTVIKDRWRQMEIEENRNPSQIHLRIIPLTTYADPFIVEIETYIGELDKVKNIVKQYLAEYGVHIFIFD